MGGVEASSRVLTFSLIIASENCFLGKVAPKIGHSIVILSCAGLSIFVGPARLRPTPGSQGVAAGQGCARPGLQAVPSAIDAQGNLAISGGVVLLAPLAVEPDCFQDGLAPCFRATHGCASVPFAPAIKCS